MRKNKQIKDSDDGLPYIKSRNPEGLYTRPSEILRKGSKESLEVEQAINPFIRSTLTLREFSKGLHAENIPLDLTESVDMMKAYAQSISQGNLRPAEEMLATQFNVLDVIFHQLALRASVSTSPKSRQIYLTMALKAQNQSRATIQTLSEIKFPKTLALVEQANIVQQQVHRTSITVKDSNNLKTPNELLELKNEKRLDNREKIETVDNHPEMEALEDFYRTEDI